MSHRIPGYGPRQLPGTGGLRSTAAERLARPTGKPVEMVAPPRDAILLIDKARLEVRLEEAVRRAPGTDMSHVLRVMDALARNEYVIDSRRVADKMLSFERELARTK